MATKVTLPELGENIESGNVAKVLVSVGDSIEKDQSIVEVETEKAVVEVPSTAAGKISEIKVKEGDELKVGGVILIIEESEDADSDESEDKEPEPEKKEPKKKDSKKEEEPEDEESDEDEEPDEDEPDEDEDSEEPEEDSGEEDDEKPEKDEDEKPKDKPKPKKDKAAEKKKTPEDSDKDKGKDVRRAVAAAPSVRRLAREIGVDISQVKPATPGGRITAEDIKVHARQASTHTAGEAAAPPLAAASGSLPDFSRWGEVNREKMSTIRRRTAERLAQAWATIPHVTQHDKSDITALEDFRKQYGKQAEKAGGKLTATAILVKLLALGLKRFPQFNASIDTESSEIVYKRYCNIGVAVDTDRGLLVPVIKNADEKSLIDIAVELGDLSERARNKKATVEEMQGGSITITNLGGIGGVGFTPIVNPPEVAILGVSRASMEPTYKDGQFVPRLMLPLSLSYDHRLIDGADAARFTRWICAALEQPLLLFLDQA